MKTNKITKDFILESIEKNARIIARKHEIYETLKEINEELKGLNENAPVLSYGFKADSDASVKKNPTGFVNSPNISYIAQLEAEMGPENSINEENVMEIEKLKKENESLKKELEAVKSKK